MKKHLFGAILFCVIVGVAIFVNLFALPKPLPVFESTDCAFNFEVNDEDSKEIINLEKVTFDRKTQKIRAIKVEKKGEFTGKERHYLLHFFKVSRGQSQFLITQDFYPSVIVGWRVYTNAVTIVSLSRLKSLKNIYVTAEFDNDYEPNSIPNFDSKLAVPISINNDKN